LRIDALLILVAGEKMAPAAYFCKPRKATFLNRRVYTIFAAPLTLWESYNIAPSLFLNLDVIRSDNDGIQ